MNEPDLLVVPILSGSAKKELKRHEQRSGKMCARSQEKDTF